MTTTEPNRHPSESDQHESGPFEVAPGNREQYAAWSGDEGELWASHPEFFDNSVRHLHRHLIAAAALDPDSRVLDLGCGNGQCARDAARAATRGRVLGIDLSQPMVRVARALADRGRMTNVDFVCGDAQIYPFDRASFDLAVSRTGAMFFGDQVAAFTNVARALRAGGRLVMVSWRSPAENEWFTSLVTALVPDAAMPSAPPPGTPSPFRHADAAHTTEVLRDAGFDDVDLQPLDTPMYFGHDAAEGFPILADMLEWVVRHLEPSERERAMDRLRRLLAAHETAAGVAFGCAAWLITARRR